jgi:hypothetical protein
MEVSITEHFHGYCKVHNADRDMAFQYSQDKYGNLYLEEADCDFDHCKQNGNCYILKQALEKENA